jgi:hypothetical protein
MHVCLKQTCITCQLRDAVSAKCIMGHMGKGNGEGSGVSWVTQSDPLLALTKAFTLLHL